MQFITSLDDFNCMNNTAVTIGKFDGLHLGHKSLLDDIQDFKAKNNNISTVIFTFSSISKSFLTSCTERRILVERLHPNYLIELPFDKNISDILAEDFVKNILIKKLKMKYLSVGDDFKFGFKRLGDIEYLKNLSNLLDFDLNIHSKVKYKNDDISSTYIKDTILKGDIKKANAMLGYNYFIIGNVVHGSGIGSNVIGYPTINIIPDVNKILPINGVYISNVIIDGKKYNAISNIGYKPTVSSKKQLGIESFLLNENFDCYERIVSVELLDFIRTEKKFESIEDLKSEITKNVKVAKEFFTMNNR